MADDIANILLRISGTADDADDTLETFAGKLAAFGKTSATAEANIDTSGSAKLATLEAALQKFGRTRAIAKAEVDTGRTDNINRVLLQLQEFAGTRKIEIPIEVQREGMDRALAGLQGLIHQRDLVLEPKIDKAKALAEFRATFAAISRDEEIELHLDNKAALLEFAALSAVINRTPIDIKTGAAVTQFAVLSAAMQAVSNQDVDVEVDTDNLRSLQAILASLAAQDKDVTVGVNTAEGEAHLLAFLVAAQGVAQDINVDVDVNEGAALADLAGLSAAVKAVDSQDIDIDVRVGKLSLTMALLQKMGSVFNQGVAGASKLGQSIGGITVNLGPFGVKLTAVTGILLGLVGAMAVSLVAAASLMVTALVGAAAAVGVLATAFVASLGPAVALAIAAFTRITKILGALKSAQAAKDDATRKSASGTNTAKQAEEQRRQSLVALGAAIRAQASAERGLQQAKNSARDAIVQANREVASSQEDVGRASQEVADQMVAGFEAIKQSAEDVRDALLAVEDARLGIQESGLAVKQAELNLKEFRQEAGLAGKEFNDIFKKSTDVSGGDVDVKKLLPSLSTGKDGKSSADQALEAERLVLAVQRAKLSEKQATDTLGDSIQNLNTQRKEAAAFQRDGLAAFEPYTNAVSAQVDATQRLADATANANTLTAQGVSGSPAVLAAQDALTSSNERLAEARVQAAKRAEPAAGSEAAAKAAEEWGKLSAAEQAFGLALQSTITNLKSFFAPAVEGVLSGLVRAFGNSSSILDPLQSSFTNFGKVVGDVFANLGKSLGDPAVAASLNTLVSGTTQLAAVMGNEVFPRFFGLILNIANAAMPLLIRGMEKFGSLLERLSSGSGGEKLNDTFDTFIDLLKGVGSLTKALGRIFIGFFTATEGSAGGFMQTITDMANRFADFLQSPAGQDAIKKFFEDVIPLAIQSFKFIGNVILFIGNAVQILAPALTGILSVINVLSSLLNGVLFILRPFLQVASQLALLFVGGLPLGIAKVISKFGTLIKIIGFLSTKFVSVVAKMIGRLGGLASFFNTAFGWIQDAVVNIVQFIEEWFGKIVGYIKYPFEQALKLLHSLGEEFFDAGKAIITGLVKGLKSVGGLPFKIIKKGFDLVGDMLPGSEPKDSSSPFAGLPKAGKAILENLASGIEANSGVLAASIEQHINPIIGAVDVAPARSARGGGSSVGTQYNGSYIANQAINMPEGAAGTDGETQAALLMMGLRRRGRG